MLKVLLARMRQGHRTHSYPSTLPEMPDRYLGAPVIDLSRCPDGCRECIDACPADALNQASVDLGRCLFCRDCSDPCPAGAISHQREFRLGAATRVELEVRHGDVLPPVRSFDASMRKLLGRSLKLRQVSAGGCNACEADTNVLNTLTFDLGRFGIQFVASPRHADGLLITGPVTKNMALALRKTYDAVPDPKIVIAVGACAISGGPYAGHPQTCGGADAVVPVDLYIPGCPPNPWTILDGILRLMGRIGDE